MPTLEALLRSGRLFDLIVVGMLIEGAGLLAFARRTGRGVPPAQLLTNLAAGICLMLALRSALAGPFWMTTVWIVGALIAHLGEIATRWRR